MRIPKGWLTRKWELTPTGAEVATAQLIPLRALWTTPEVEISAEIGNEQ
jgi:hypothetical protein